MTTMDYNDMPASERRSLSIFPWLRTAFTSWRKRAARRRTLQSISELDAYLLRDIGLSPEDVDRGLMGKQRSIWLNPLSDDDK